MCNETCLRQNFPDDVIAPCTEFCLLYIGNIHTVWYAGLRCLASEVGSKFVVFCQWSVPFFVAGLCKFWNSVYKFP